MTAQRQAWQRSITDDQGNLLTGVQISVFERDGVTPATIYSGLSGAAATNPFNTGVQTVARFYAGPGRYVVRAFKSGHGTQEWIDVDLSGEAVRIDVPESVACIADLPLASGPLVDGRQFSVAGFYNGATEGAGRYAWSASTSKLEHNGGTVLALEAIEAWDGTREGIQTLLEWAGFGVGCFVLLDAAGPIDIRTFGGDYLATGVDCGRVANHIFTKLGAVDIHFPRGAWSIATGVQLLRGCSISGSSTFDDATGSRLVKAPDLAQPVVATMKYYGGESTHYYALTGVCIVGNRLTRGPLAAMVEAVAWWGVFVGSYIDNVFIVNNYGPGISFEHGYDTKIGLLWVNQCEVGDTSAFEIDQQLNNPGGPVGLIEIDSLYIENVYRTTEGGAPKTNQDNRGHAIKAGMVYRLDIAHLHQEACDTGLMLTHGTCYSISVGTHSISWCGRVDGKNSAHYWDGVVPQVYKVGPVVAGDRGAGFAFLDASASVIGGGQIGKIPTNTGRWGGMSFVSSAGQKKDTFSPQFVGNVLRKPIGAQTTSYSRSQVTSADAARYHFDKTNGDFWTFGSSSSQPGGAEKDFFRIESYGNSGDRVRFFLPFVIPVFESVGMVNAFYITPAGELRIRIGASTYKADLTPV